MNDLPQSPSSKPSNPKLTRRGFFRAGIRTGIGLGTLSLSSIAWARVEVDWVEVVHVELTLPRLPQQFDGFRIAQISDIHIEGGDMRTQFPEAAKFVTQQGADVIVVTGDLTTSADNWQSEPLVAGLKHLKAPSGVFGILGSHDQWYYEGEFGCGARVAREALASANIRELSNTVFPIEREGATLWMCGIDDWLTGNSDLNAVITALPQDGCAILLGHEPDYADDVAETGRFDLMLSGHSHGGQIAMPVVGPIHLPPGGRKYPRGKYQLKEMTLYTNWGLGVIEFPMRLCARPEVTVFTLRAPK